MNDDKKSKIESFEQLTVWQESQVLAVQVYSLTKQFPREELFSLTNQIRRAVSRQKLINAYRKSLG